jgi:TetR/AcrR family transcriptional regulator, transcriptional repressor for nem operon
MTTDRAERADVTPKLTAKGVATRARIVEQAAELIYVNGVHGTNNELLRKAAGISGSQLNHYFPDKESLVLAVITWRAEQILYLHTSEHFAGFDTIGTLREWASFYINYEHACQEGCTLGSLASEVVKADLDVRDQLTVQFDRWADIFRGGLERMRIQGRLRADADPNRLGNLLMAALQGGMLLAQIAQDTTPLSDALTAAIDHVQTFETVPVADQT